MKTAEIIISFFKKFISHTGVYFTLSVLMLNAFTNLSGQTTVFDTGKFGIILLFSVILALIDFVLVLKFLPIAARAVIHAVLAVADFVLVFAYLSGVAQRSSTALYTAVLFIIIYIIVVLPKYVYRAVAGKKKNSGKPYKPQFAPKEK